MAIFDDTPTHDHALHCPPEFSRGPTLREQHEAREWNASGDFARRWLRHEWRALYRATGGGLIHAGYYCIHCPATQSTVRD